MKNKMTKSETEQLHPLVIVNARGEFLQGRRWVEEYPDADKFKPTGEKRQAVKIAGEKHGKVVANYGQNDEEVIADCLLKPWHVKTDTKAPSMHSGPSYYVGQVNASEIDSELPKGTKILSAERILYEDGKPISADDRAINEAVRTLITRTGETGKSLCLLSNEGEAPYILPALINGAVEYQVSDGIDGQRSNSADSYTWSEAMKDFEEMKALFATAAAAAAKDVQ